MENILSEISYDSEALESKDHVLAKLRLKSMEIDKNVCVKCSKNYEITARTCPDCKHDPNFFSDRNELYNDVESCHLTQPVEVKMGEIIGVNPNSRDNIKFALKRTF